MKTMNEYVREFEKDLKANIGPGRDLIVECEPVRPTQPKLTESTKQT